MTRYLPKMLIVSAVLVALASGAWAQGWAMGRGRWANVSEQDLAKMADLHQQIREAQWKLWQLKGDDAEKKQIEKQTREVLQLRERLSRVVTELPAGPCYQADPDGSPPAAGRPGWGRGGRGFGQRGMGAGMGRGRGMGRGGGMGYGRGGGGGRGWGWGGQCPWGYQPPQAQPQATE